MKDLLPVLLILVVSIILDWILHLSWQHWKNRDVDLKSRRYQPHPDGKAGTCRAHEDRI